MLQNEVKRNKNEMIIMIKFGKIVHNETSCKYGFNSI